MEPEPEPEPPALPLAGRVAIVTGSSGGIGREVALHLASLGASLVLADRRPPATAPCLPDPSRTTAVETDVTSAASVAELFDHAARVFGPRLHILVHCAGVAVTSFPTVAGTRDSDWDSALGVNAKGTFLCCREAARRLVRGGGGRIIAFSSSTAAAVPPMYGAYAASKAAVEATVQILAKELKGSRITANCIAPGPIATEMFFAGKSESEVRRNAEANPLGRLGEPTDVASVVGFLAGDAAEWVNGQVIRVNGGLI